MDPFTEKLLERTRARRENLQKKMAERPNAANRPVAKRPLADANSVVSKPVVENVPQVSSKPSPSKRRCSEENMEPAVGEDHQNPVKTQQLVTLSDPPTDKKPPVGPSSVRSASSSLERATPQPSVPSQPQQPERMVVAATAAAGGLRADVLPDGTKEQPVEEEPAPPVTGMRSRLQRLAEQRKCWDGDSSDAVPESAPLCLTRQVEVAPAPAPVHAPSGTPLGRRGRLANLAATIGSWEDDLSHTPIPSRATAEKTSQSVVKATPKDAAVATGTSAAASGKTPSTTNQIIYSPVKSSRVVPPSPQKADVPASRPVLMTTVSSPQKSSIQAAPPAPATHSPLKSQGITRGANLVPSPQKPELRAKPFSAAPQERVVTATPGVKSFAERFGERCQERNTQNNSAGGATHTKTFTVTPTAVTPNTRMVQERLRAAQAMNTATADLTQRQKMERESELAQIRARFQKGNMWKNKDEAAAADVKEPLDKPAVTEVSPPSEPREEVSSEPTLSSGSSDTPVKRFPPGQGLLISPPASTSSPMKVPSDVDEKTSAGRLEEEKEGDEVKENQSINSAVINGLFEGILEQSEEQKDHSNYHEEEEEEEEDALNISSMSLLTPLAETVAAVVKSPERKMMTSTPATSFIVRSNTPEVAPQPNRFQTSSLTESVSSDSMEAFDQDHKLPYSVDAYRSTRVKETERSSVKQVIVRKEDVSQRADQAQTSGVLSVKQKMKVLTSEMNLQQTVIHQASQALNCCTDEEHGKGSQVEAEAQRLLLVATERREALKAELDRLKGAPAGQKKAPAASDPSSISASKGSITLQELRLPLKADFVCSTANRPESTKYSFFIMIRAGAENTVATPLASTHRGLSGDTLSFPTRFTLADVSSSFEIDIEVYGLVQKREEISDKKKKPSKSKTIWRQVYEAHDLCMSAITPKRFLAITKSAQTPVVASPGGPNSVRTSNFVLVGSHKLTLSSVGKDKFPLEKMKHDGEVLSDMFHSKVPFLCPLEGHVHLKLQCDVGSRVEEKGFLTMFEDVSGFGAWHRRWCILTGYCISYWTYPDDEKRKKPLGRINLANCTSSRVEPVNREFCARPNTLELITVRPQREDDRETLVSQCHNTMCVTKNWLSADTKEERNLWMSKLNQILMDLRMWKPDSCYRPQ